MRNEIKLLMQQRLAQAEMAHVRISRVYDLVKEAGITGEKEDILKAMDEAADSMGSWKELRLVNSGKYAWHYSGLGELDEDSMALAIS